MKTKESGPSLRGVSNWWKSTEAQVKQQLINVNRREVRKHIYKLPVYMRGSS